MIQPIPTMIVPTLNGAQRLSKLLASIDYPVEQLIIINNDARRWSVQMWVLDAFLENQNIGDMDVIDLPSNLGVAASWNLGIKVAPFSDYWCIVNDDVTFEPGSLAILAADSSSDHVTVSDCPQLFSAFCVGERVVERVGLFDEAYYPAYFEDTEFKRRADHLMGFGVLVYSEAKVFHNNSSTICSDSALAVHNHRTYSANSAVYESKVEQHDYSVSGWSLAIRRRNDWGGDGAL